MSFIVFNKIARDMEAAGFGNPLLYFNMHKLLYTRNEKLCRSSAFGNAQILAFHESIGTISVYSANAEWNMNEITVPGVN